jgi:hypothetical protein
MPDIEYMPKDAELAAEFLQSDEWKAARDSGSWLKKGGFRVALRRYLVRVYPWLANDDEHTECEQYIGRIQYIIRSRWSRKGAKTRSIKRARRRRVKIALAECAHARWRKARAPELWDELPVQLMPRKSRGTVA